MYAYEISPSLTKKLRKVRSKNRPLYEQAMQKINEIINTSDIEHYKKLHHPLSGFQRVHLGHFVLTFEFRQKEGKIFFDDLDHHDNIY